VLFLFLILVYTNRLSVIEPMNVIIAAITTGEVSTLSYRFTYSLFSDRQISLYVGKHYRVANEHADMNHPISRDDQLLGAYRKGSLRWVNERRLPATATRSATAASSHDMI